MWLVKNYEFDSIVHCSSLECAQRLYYFLKRLNVNCSIIHLTSSTFLSMYSLGKIISMYKISQPSLFDGYEN